MSLVLEHVSYSYDEAKEKDAPTLSDVTLTLDACDFLGIAGPSGSGKSTLLQIMAGLISPRAGYVQYNQKNLSIRKEAAHVRGQIGLVFQYPEHQLFASSVRQDIAFGPKNLGLSSVEIEQRVRYACDLMEIPSAWLDKSPFELSGGQQRSVALAGVFAMKPRVLLLDEPCAGLDSAARAQFFHALSQMQSEGTALCMASHNMDDMAAHCNRVLVLSAGQVKYLGKPSELFQHENWLTELGLDIPAGVKLVHALQLAGIALPEKLYTAIDLAATLAELKQNK